MLLNIKNTFNKNRRKRGIQKMLFRRKRDVNEKISLKQEIFEEVLIRYRNYKIICFIEAVIIISLVLVIALKGA